MSFFKAFQDNNDQLNAPRHKGFGKIGLDCAGRLLPGYLFDGNGNVVPSIATIEGKKPTKRKARLSNDCDHDCKDDTFEKNRIARLKRIAAHAKKIVEQKQLKKTTKAKVFKPVEVKKTTPKPKVIVAKKTDKDLVEPVKVTPVAKKVTVAAKKVTVTPKNVTKSSNVFNVKITDIVVDKKRFQNREKLNQQVLDNIVNNYDETVLDPIILWIDPKDKKTYLLAGHHRLEGTRLTGRKTIAAKYKIGTESEMIKYAKFDSNANRSLETPIERAKIYRELRKTGLSKTKILEQAKSIEPKYNYVIALSYLEPSGIVINALNALETTDTQNLKIIETIAEWIGMAKSNHELTPAHEKEMFNFLMDKDASKRITTKADFLQKIHAIAGDAFFDKNDILNLNRFKYQTEGQSVYDAEFNELKLKINKCIDNKASLKDRISNPKNPEFIKPTDKDYAAILRALDTAMNKYTDEIAFYQKKIIELSRNKGKYTNAGANQVGLFGSKKKDQLNSPTPTYNTGFKVNEPEPETTVLVENDNKRSLANRIANRPVNQEYFEIYCKQIAGFLGAIERKTKESVFISLTGGEGSMKTRMCFQFMNALAQNYKVGHASIEEHPESALYYDKVDEYLNQTAINNIEAPEIRTLNDLHELISRNDVIVIDSYTKMKEIFKGFEVDKDLRKKYNGKLFIVIFQQTVTGSMRGGSKSQFDADIVLFTQQFDDYEKNFIYASKNRYNSQKNLKYNIFNKKLIGAIIAPDVKPKFKVN